MKWEQLRSGGGNVGTPFACPTYPIKSVQAVGTWGGATLTMQGSNMIETPTYFTLVDIFEDNIAFTENDGAQIVQNTYWVRPNLSGGNTTTDIDVYLLCVTER